MLMLVAWQAGTTVSQREEEAQDGLSAEVAPQADCRQKQAINFKLEVRYFWFEAEKRSNGHRCFRT
jgi:hypothetical protein